MARGQAHLEAKRHATAVAAFDEALAADPDHLVALYQRANAHFGQGDLVAARNAVHAALDRHPGQPDLLMLAGAIAAAGHDPVGALVLLVGAGGAEAGLAGGGGRMGELRGVRGGGAE
ncbi:MAG: tetratricopeptide repeat protein, partial [Vicinamibacteria bacterium]